MVRSIALFLCIVLSAPQAVSAKAGSRFRHELAQSIMDSLLLASPYPGEWLHLAGLRGPRRRAREAGGRAGSGRPARPLHPPAP